MLRRCFSAVEPSGLRRAERLLAGAGREQTEIFLFFLYSSGDWCRPMFVRGAWRSGWGAPVFLVGRLRYCGFAEDGGVARGGGGGVERGRGGEVGGHAAARLQILGDRAALFVDAIEGEGQARRRMQPLQLAGDAKPRFVKMANLRLGHALADELVDLPHLLRLLSAPADDPPPTDQRRPAAIVPP